MWSEPVKRACSCRALLKPRPLELTQMVSRCSASGRWHRQFECHPQLSYRLATDELKAIRPRFTIWPVNDLPVISPISVYSCVPLAILLS